MAVLGAKYQCKEDIDLATSELLSPTRCSGCSQPMEPQAKFCGNCGSKTSSLATISRELADIAIGRPASAGSIQVSNIANKQAAQVRKAAQKSASATPAFAKKKKRVVPAEIREELSSIYTLIVREKIFLIFHYAVFLIINLIGFAIASKCYFEFHGDEITKTMIATTPLLFINLVALTCLVPIKGTKRELARLRERETYVKLKLEYDTIMEG